METLYDLLGALPRDDAEELRAAFRRAVKGAHPDLNPDDPDAGQKFREIVRANDILADEEQRAAYDHLLALAEQEQKQRSTFKAVHGAAPRVIALAVAAGLGIGIYFAQGQSPEFSAALKHLAEATLVRPGDFAGIAPPASAERPQVAAVLAGSEAAPQDATMQAPAAKAATRMTSADPAPAADSAATDLIVPIPVTPVTIAATEPAGRDGIAPASVGPPLEIAPGDPKVFRERGIFAYRSGDLNGAVAEFDRAIALDPKFSAAYVDRSIVLYRMQKFDRAFADIAQARRLDGVRRAAKASAVKKPKAAQPAASPVLPLFQRRTAKLEASTTR